MGKGDGATRQAREFARLPAPEAARSSLRVVVSGHACTHVGQAAAERRLVRERMMCKKAVRAAAKSIARTNHM